MSWVEAITLALRVMLALVRDRLDPERALARAIETLANDWRKRTDAFAEAAHDRDLDRLSALLSDLERRRLRDQLARDADGDRAP